MCTESTYNKDKKKFNSIIIGTVSSVGMLLVVLGIAGFVFWRVNQREADCKSTQLLYRVKSTFKTIAV